MESQGFEVAINTVNLRRKDFEWLTSFNIGYQETDHQAGVHPRLGDAIVQGGAAVLGGPRRGLFSTKFAGLDYRGFQPITMVVAK